MKERIKINANSKRNAINRWANNEKKCFKGKVFN